MKRILEISGRVFVQRLTYMSNKEVRMPAAGGEFMSSSY